MILVPRENATSDLEINIYDNEPEAVVSLFLTGMHRAIDFSKAR